MEPKFKRSSGAAAGLTDAIAVSGRDFIDYDPVGLPDEQDIQNIRNIINNFRRAKPGVIEAFVRQAKADREISDASFLLPNQRNETRRRVLTMPTPLLREIEEAYPLMFRNKAHLNWFKKHFTLFNSHS